MTKRLSRRGFARLGLGAVAAAFGCTPQPKTQPRPAEKPFTVRLGLQSYSLRAFGFDDAVKKAQALGLHFLEAFPAHLPQNLKPEELTARLARLKTAGIKVNGYGVCGIGKNEAATRALFGFARKVGIEVISAAAAPDALGMLDKLVAEYDVKIGIHNHGPGDRTWGRLQQLLDGTKDHHPNIGVCLDTGHLVRAGDDPIEAVRRLGPRLHSFHFKDTNAQKHDVGHNPVARRDPQRRREGGCQGRVSATPAWRNGARRAMSKEVVPFEAFARLERVPPAARSRPGGRERAAGGTESARQRLRLIWRAGQSRSSDPEPTT